MTDVINGNLLLNLDTCSSNLLTSFLLMRSGVLYGLSLLLIDCFSLNKTDTNYFKDGKQTVKNITIMARNSVM